MKKIISVLLVMTVSLVVLSCKGEGKSSYSGKYADLYAVMEEMAGVLETLDEDLEKTENASDFAKAIEKYGKSMKSLLPKLEAMNEKYPEMETEDPPAEFAVLEQRINVASESFQIKMMELAMEYYEDPAVAAVMEDLASMMIE